MRKNASVTYLTTTAALAAALSFSVIALLAASAQKSGGRLGVMRAQIGSGAPSGAVVRGPVEANSGAAIGTGGSLTSKGSPINSLSDFIHRRFGEDEVLTTQELGGPFGKHAGNGNGNGNGNMGNGNGNNNSGNNNGNNNIGNNNGNFNSSNNNGNNNRGNGSGNFK